MLSLKEEVGVAARVLSAVTRFFSPPEANFSSPPKRSDYAAQVAVADTQRSAVLNQNSARCSWSQFQTGLGLGAGFTNTPTY